MLEKIIYLPNYAKKQLETSDNSSIWAKPIPYKDKPARRFTSQVTLREDTLELGEDYVLEGGRYHPDRDQDLESTIEGIQTVSEPKPKRKKVTIKPGDKIKVYLHGAGVTSSEKETVAKVGKKYLIIEADEGSPNKFDMATGKCVNDTDPRYSLGFYRTIDKLL